MSDIDPQPLALRPFQAAALERFFSTDAPRIQALSSPAGTGKATTASAIVAETFRQGATGVAVLATRNVVAQGIAWRAAAVDLTPFELHRAVALSTSTGLVPRWPKSVLTFGSLRQAAREPISHAMTMRRWDLIVIDLTGGLDGDVDTVRNVLERTQIDRVLLLRDGLSLPNRWSWLNAAPLPYPAPDVPDGASPPLVFSVVEYEWSAIEIDLVRRAQQFAVEFRHLGVGSRMRLPAAVSSRALRGAIDNLLSIAPLPWSRWRGR